MHAVEEQAATPSATSEGSMCPMLWIGQAWEAQRKRRR